VKASEFALFLPISMSEFEAQRVGLGRMMREENPKQRRIKRERRRNEWTES
jgi:hypothetical protein